MRSFELYYENFDSSDSSEKTSALSHYDLYNFYYLATLLSMGLVDGEYSHFIAKDYLGKLKEKYVRVFSGLVYDQIVKYVERGRVDQDLTMEVLQNAKNSPRELDILMNKTFRSNMKDRNRVWNLVSKYVLELSNAISMKDICFFIDRINNCIHNTSELLFSKFSNAQILMSAFDTIHNAQSLNVYKSKVNKDIREISNQ